MTGVLFIRKEIPDTDTDTHSHRENALEDEGRD